MHQLQSSHCQPAAHNNLPHGLRWLVCVLAHARGLLTDCRNGTPRQPHLVPSARAELKLAIDVPAACLKGLQGFSHCWVLYVFHQNTGAAVFGAIGHVAWLVVAA